MCANVSETANLSSTDTGLLISCCREAVGGAQNPKDRWKKMTGSPVEIELSRSMYFNPY